jgi:signal transduction histidine kinase/CheY-like chemotaxis protein
LQLPQYSRVRVDRSASVRPIVTALTLYAAAGSLLTLAGWMFDLRRLADWDSDGVAQMPNNAIGIAALAGAVFCLSRRWNLVARLLAGFAALIAAATLFEWSTGIDLGIDRLFFYRPWGQKGTVAPGRMGLPGAAAMAILGVSVLFGTFRRTRRFTTQGGAITLCIAMLSIIGYAFSADPLYAIPRFTTIALQTSTMLLALGAALIAAIPESMPVRMLLGDSATSLLVRRALPGIVFLPILLGWLQLRGRETGMFDASFGTAILVLSLIGLLGILLFRAASAISRHENAMRESRDQLAGLLGSITDAFFSVDPEWHLTFANEEAESRFGRPVIGRLLWDVLQIAPDSEAGRELLRVMGERTSVDLEVLHEPSGRWFLHRAYPTGDGGLAVYSRDMTERKQAEESMRRSAEALLAADQMKDEFLATLSHELRTPLTAIVGWSEMLLRGKLEESAHSTALEAIRSSARAQAQLIEDVLDVSRIVTGKMRLECEETDLSRVIEAAAAAVRPAADAKRIALRLTLAADLPVAFVDADRVQQIVWNLLSNAIKFSPQRSAVDLVLRFDADGYTLEVTDEGPGIPVDFLPHLFERFRQADGSTSRAHGGLGIGLALSRDLVELHGGTIDATNVPGRGARFTVRLPLPPPRVSAATESAVREGSQPAAMLQGVRILCVEDRAEARLLIAEMLRQYGAEVVAVDSAIEAITARALREPDLVITDLAMPGSSGYDLLHMLRAQPAGRQLLVLALTAQASVADEARARGAGFDGFLRKPIESRPLAEAVAAALSIRKRDGVSEPDSRAQ